MFVNDGVADFRSLRRSVADPLCHRRIGLKLKSTEPPDEVS